MPGLIAWDFRLVAEAVNRSAMSERAVHCVISVAHTTGKSADQRLLITLQLRGAPQRRALQVRG
jgi:hypothetical protein